MQGKWSFNPEPSNNFPKFPLLYERHIYLIIHTINPRSTKKNPTFTPNRFYKNGD